MFVRKQNSVQEATGDEIAHWLCKSATLRASQTKSIKPNAKLILLLVDRKHLVACKILVFTTPFKSDL